MRRFSTKQRIVSQDFKRWQLAIILGLLLISKAGAQITQTWDGGSQNYNAPNWNGGNPPSSGSNIATSITTANSVVSVNGVFITGKLTLGASDTLGINNGQQYTIDASGGFAGAGTITNAGNISVNSTTNVTNFSVEGAGTLTGGGTVTLADNSRIMSFTTGSLENVNNTIQGATGANGDIGGNALSITNDAGGVINANVNGDSIDLLPSSTGGLTNLGTLEASNGGTLYFDGNGSAFYTNTGGTIKALTGSEVILIHNAPITGGTLTTAGTGTIHIINGSITNVTNSGTLLVDSGGVGTMGGTITNSGTMTIGSTANATILQITGNTTLTGGGTVILQNNARLTGTAGILTNVNNTIEGDTNTGGNLGSGIGIVNQASGVINANNNGKTLFVNATGVNGLVNQGTLEASNGGILDLDGSAGATFTNTGGTIEALTGSQVSLTNDAPITGGTLTTVGTGSIHTVTAGSLTNVTNSGTFIGDNNSVTTIGGTITNSGTMTFATSGNNTRLEVLTPTTLTGGGTVNLTSMTIVEGTSVLTNANNTIQGETSGTAGSFGGNSLGIVNQANGIIDANVSTKTLFVDPSAANLTNTGLMEATNGGLLVLTGEGNGTFDNTSGTIQATGAGSQVQLTQGASITGGTLATASGGTIHDINTATLTNLTNSGAFVGDDGTATTIAGTINNTGSITLATSGNNTRLEVLTPTTLTGGGTVNLTSLTIVEGTSVLTNANNTIQGENNGGVSSLGANAIGIVNQANGIIDANVSTKTLFVDPGAGNLSNAGTMEATNGGLLVLTGEGGGTFDNTGGTIQASGAGSQVQLTQGASITGGTLATASGGMIVNINTASLTNVTNSGAFVGNNGTTTSVAGTITNNGTMTFNASSNLALTANTTLAGTGTTSLVTGDAVGGTGAFTLTNNSNIVGSGTLGNGQIGIINGGLINANLTGQTLTVNPTSFTNNNGSTARASNGGILDFTGNVTNNGTLDAAVGSTIDVAGTLSGSGLVTGNGTLVNPNFTSNGTVTPGTGGAPGTLSLTGNYTQGAGGTLVIQVNGTTPGTGYSVFNVSGTANLGGTLKLQSNGLFPGTTGQMLTFLNAGTAVNGTFATLDNLSGISFNVQYNANNVQLIITQNMNGFDRPGLTPNQHATGRYLDGVVPTATGSVATLIGALNVVPVSGLPDALNQISPQSLQVWRHIAFDDATFASQLTGNHLANRRDGVTGFDSSQLTYTESGIDPTLSQIKNRLLAWDPPAPRGLLSDVADPILGGVDTKKMISPERPSDPWSTWIAGNVILADLSHDQDLAHQDYTTGGVTLGADYQLDQHFLVGGLLAYGHTDATLDHIGSKTTDDSYSPGIYASYVDGGWYGNGMFSYGYNSYTSDRNIQIGTLSGDNHGATQGNLYVTNLTGGYEFKENAWKFGPVASLQYAHLDINSFTEQGPSALNLNNQNDDSLRSQLGAEARYAVHCGGCNLTPHISATWQHEFLDNSNGITSQLNGSGAGSFTVQSTSTERDSAFIDLGVDSKVADNVTIFTDYETQVGQSHFFAQSVQAGVKIGF